VLLFYAVEDYEGEEEGAVVAEKGVITSNYGTI
jgi:hypothetical protein